jgi:hypothetical protein
VNLVSFSIHDNEPPLIIRNKKMNPYLTHRAVTAFTLAAGIVLLANARKDIPPAYREMREIVNSQALTKEQKLAAVSAYFEKDCYWPGVLHTLDGIDKSRTWEIALGWFRKPDTSRLHKYQLAKYLLNAQDPMFARKPGDPPGFITDYRSFLIDAILNGGKEEFCVPTTGAETAVGEYAGISGGIDAPRGVLFSDVADKRVIPVLIECLAAPDHVYPEEQGDYMRGKPGDSTGRNTQRQGIPLALAKLNATEAIPALRQILFTHYDYYLRYNSAYALAILLPLQEVTQLQEQLLHAKPSQLLTLPNGKRTLEPFLFPIGKGLLERGADDGIRLMSLTYDNNPDNFSLLHVLYFAEQRMALMKSVKSPKVESFYSELLSHEALRAIFLFNAKDVTYEEPGYDEKTRKSGVRNMPEKGLNQNAKRIIALYSCILDGLKLNNIHGLDQQIKAIGRATESAEIRQLSQTFLARENK